MTKIFDPAAELKAVRQHHAACDAAEAAEEAFARAILARNEARRKLQALYAKQKETDYAS